MLSKGDRTPAGEKTPVTIIAGYLGAGKTTLINACLKTRGERKIAVLVNDFGDINIDAALIESQTDTVLNLAGGCVCCSIGSDFMNSLAELAALPNKFDHVLVETSGVALPKPIAQSIALSQSFEIDAIFVLADSETIKHHLTDRYVGDLVRQQLLQADCILLTKSDLVSPRSDQFTEVNTDASADKSKEPIPRRELGQVLSQELSLELIQELGTGFSGPVLSMPKSAYSCNWLLGGLAAASSSVADAPKVAGQLMSSVARSHWLTEPDGMARFKAVGTPLSAMQASAELFESLAIELDAPIDLPSLRAALLHLASGPVPMLIRAKGIVRDRDHPSQWQLLQLVGQRLALTDLPAPLEQNANAMIVLVLIGIRREMLARQGELNDFVALLQR